MIGDKFGVGWGVCAFHRVVVLGGKPEPGMRTPHPSACGPHPHPHGRIRIRM